MADTKIDNFFSFIYDIIGTLFKVLVVMFIILLFFFRQVNVNGHSMNDTLKHQDRLIVWSFNYTPQKGDIVIISHGAVIKEPLIKRVIATEGQRINIDYETGEVSVDGMILKEDYIKGKTIKPDEPIEVSNILIPEGYVFVMGDNREHSSDSRSIQVDLIPVNNIIGKAVFRLYPFESFGAL